MNHINTVCLLSKLVASKVLFGPITIENFFRIEDTLDFETLTCEKELNVYWL